jgi:uncharacterized protein (DUF2062 family)
VTNFRRRIARALRDLWERAKNEHSSPAEIGRSMAIGAFTACTPFVGFHLGIALALATALKQNRIWAMIGSRLSTTPIFLVTTFSEIQFAHRLRTGTWLTMSVQDVMSRGPELILDWGLGCLVLGTAIAVAVGLAATALARRWQQVRPRALEALRPPSSESPQ